MIAILDYGVGNLFSLKASLRYLGAEAELCRRPEELAGAERLILPGVGAFKDARKKLQDSGLEEALREEVAKGKPLLGICLGMQMLFDRSYEYGCHEGLGLIPGEVRYIETELKVPHIGWNRLEILEEDPLLKYTREGDSVYYVHSYYATGCLPYTLATSEYDVVITGAVRKDNVWGTQFHPEKSGKVGLGILRAFTEIEGEAQA